MQAAFDELARLGTGIQLTPGNKPTPGFAAHVEASGVTTRRHHGFAFDARKTETWSNGACLVESESVHPPMAGQPWSREGRIIEVMYPGYELGTGDEVERAMADAMPLAVDVSHVHIQRARGVMDDRVWRRLADYAHIAEVHVSANAGRHDTHEPLAASTFGLDWARERLQAGTPTVLECYMHRLSVDERRRQIDLVREGL